MFLTHKNSILAKLKKSQRGVSTTLISATMLMLITMVSVMNANMTIMDNKTSSNEYRTLQALMAAQAGIDFALSNLSQSNLLDIAETEITSDIGMTSVVTGFYSVSVDSTDVTKVIVTALGESADRSASKSLTQTLLFATTLRSDAKAFLAAPLIVSGNAEVDIAKISVGVAPSDAAARVWAGGAITGTGIPVGLAGGIADPVGLRMLASRLYENDSAAVDPMSTLFAGQMLANDSLELKNMAVYEECSTGLCENPVDLIDVKGRSKLHYNKGKLSLKGVTIGTAANPVIVMVDVSNGETFEMKNNAVINGLLFVRGNWDNKNKLGTVNGVVIVDGSIIKGNGLTINYDINVLDGMSSVGVFTRLPGSWTDS